MLDSASLSQFAQSPDDQKATFYAVWEGIDEVQKFSLISLLRSLAGSNENRYAKAERFSKANHHLRYKASMEHDCYVARLLDFLFDLSVLAVEQMISLTESGPQSVVDQQGTGSETDDLSSLSSTTNANPSGIAKVQNVARLE